MPSKCNFRRTGVSYTPSKRRRLERRLKKLPDRIGANTSNKRLQIHIIVTLVCVWLLITINMQGFQAAPPHAVHNAVNNVAASILTYILYIYIVQCISVCVLLITMHALSHFSTHQQAANENENANTHTTTHICMHVAEGRRDNACCKQMRVRAEIPKCRRAQRN